MRYYKTIQDGVGDWNTVEKQLQKMNHEYPRTFQLHQVTHLKGAFDSTFIVATFSWDDDEDNWGPYRDYASEELSTVTVAQAEKEKVAALAPN